MDTAIECMPCFRKMAEREALIACPNDLVMQQKIIDAWGTLLSKMDLSVPPPAIARVLAELVHEMSGCHDLYIADKKESNALVCGLLPALKDRVDQERHTNGDPLGLALELSIIGNYIDRGVEIQFDLEKELAEVAGSIPVALLSEFKALACEGASVLILGDNTGEIVLDMLIVEELKRIGCDVTFAVRSKPVLNDATMEDAHAVGMTALCRVVESGVDTPGTVLERCTPEFIDLMRQADVILSKGQGNFESLEGIWPGVFCAFKVKCPRIARRTGLDFGTSAFCRTTGDDAAATVDGGGGSCG